MKLTEIYVDGFGVWHDLRLRKLSSEITVFYGPNEAGKTTLMHFARAMLYGVTAERRERYLPPRAGGKPGGTLGLLSDEGPFEAARYAERGDDDRGRVTITLPDGEEQGDRLLREALESVDERTFSNVFAIGLDEINELGALEGAEAARWIYRLTSGLDRVSLYDVIQGLRASRKQLLGPSGKPSVIADLLAKREQLQTEIGELAVGNRRWAKLSIEIEEAESQVEQLEAELKEAERRARRIEIALGLKPLWTERERVVEQRGKFSGLPTLPEKPLETLDELNTRAEELQRQRDVLQGQRRQVHQEMGELGINDILVRSRGRLEALEEQQVWLASLERQSEELGEEVERLDARVESEEARLAKLWRHTPEPEAAPELDDEVLDQLQPAADALAEAERLVADAKRDLDATRGTERHYESQMQSTLTASEKLGLPDNLEDAGELVAQLRQRMKAEQRVDQAKRRVNDLEQESLSLVDAQVLPIELFVFLGALFVTAAVVLCWPWITSGPVTGWWFAALLGGVGVIALRYWLEESKAEKLDTCHQQIHTAQRQVEKAQEEHGSLDEELPLTEGTLASRLQKAEQHLEELEKMLPVEAERRKANKLTASAEEYYRSAKGELAEAEKEWRVALAAVGLPDETTPSELEKLATQHRGLEELRSRSETKQEELERCEAEYAKVVKRIAALAEEADLVLDEEEPEPLEQLAHLLSESRLQQGRIDHRKKLRAKAKELKEKQNKLAKSAERVETEREALFLAVGVDGEQAFRQIVADWAEAFRLEETRDRLTREIAAAIGKSGAEEDYAELLAADALMKLDDRWSELTSEHDALEKQLRELAVRRGALDEQRRAIIEDTSLADKRVELDLIEGQLAEARERWRERAAVGSMLELIRSDYEQHRQPETLVEASKYLEKLTRGRYPRVWTPLAEDVLLVDNAEGESLRVESLSRGAREQLFLSVRLALVAMYARRGVQLPMVLDDVLVNFDDGRAQIAASVLTEFARDGHQLFVFTCHEHVWEMFKELRVDVRRLPVRYEDQVVEEEPIVIGPEADTEPEPAVEEPIEEPLPVAVQERIAAPPAAPEPSFVEAEYLPLEPVTEVRRVIEMPEEPETAPAAEATAYGEIAPTGTVYGEPSEPAGGVVYGEAEPVERSELPSEKLVSPA